MRDLVSLPCLAWLSLLLVMSYAASGLLAAEAGNDAAGDTVGVFFATNRTYRDQRDPESGLTGERGTPRFGRCVVRFTPIPGLNTLSRQVPFHVANENPQVIGVKYSDRLSFFEQVARQATRTDSGSIALFVHGYNYGFARGCRMAAAMQRVLGDRASVLLFSWPSNGKLSDYLQDQADIEWAVPFLSNMIRELGQAVGPNNLNIVAHSLGTRGVMLALQRLAGRSDVRPLAAQLILLAPDFDAQVFIDVWPEMAPLTGRVTLYASENDTPLALSRRLHGHPRLGEGGKHLTVIPGIETIDVSSLGRYQITGHEYYHFHPRVAEDLAALLTGDTPAAQRGGLRSRNPQGPTYWEFDTQSLP